MIEAKDITQHISCFLSLSHEDRKCVRSSSLILFFFFFFFASASKKKNRSKDASGLADQSHEKEEDDGCDLDRTYVRDKHLLWPSELSWTDRQTDSQTVS